MLGSPHHLSQLSRRPRASPVSEMSCASARQKIICACTVSQSTCSVRAQCRRAPAAWPLKSSLCSDMGPFSTIHRFSTQHDMGYTNSRPDWSQETLFDEHFTLSSPNCRRYGRRACRGTSLELLPVLCLPVLCLSCPVCGQPTSGSAMT